MKQLLLITALILIIIAEVQAKKIEGQIITSTDTLKVLLNIPVKFVSQELDYEKLQQKIFYFDTANTKIQVHPSQALEIRFVFGSETIRMVSVNNTLRLGSVFAPDSKIFLRLRVDGYVKLFAYYDTRSSGGAYNSGAGMMMGSYSSMQEYGILQKGNQGLMKPSWISFRKDMTSYFSDCTVVVNMLQYKELGSGDMQEIVTLYNKHCASQPQR